MYYYSFHIGDYKASTSHLSNEEDLAYRRLLDMYYDTEMPIPLDTHWVARRVKVSITVVESVLCDFFVKTDAGWANSKCQDVIDAYRRQVSGGKKGAEKRWKDRVPNGVPMPTPLGGDAYPYPPPIATINHKPITNKETTTTVASGDAPVRKQKTSDKPDDVSDEVWDSFLQQRHKTKSIVTPLVITQFRKEAGKAGISLEDALSETVSRGWKGFKAEWISNTRSVHLSSTVYDPTAGAL